MNLRILITGSRNLPESKFDEIFIDVLGEILDAWIKVSSVTIVHGGCPTGADKIAGMVVNTLAMPFPVTEEVHSADWGKYGRSAGPKRNQLMVDKGADICLAYPLGESRGTRDCIRRAQKAGIETIVWEG